MLYFGSSRKKTTANSEILLIWGWGYNLAVEHLPSMCKALDSIPSIGEKKGNSIDKGL